MLSCRKTFDEHFENLRWVVQRLENFGVKFKAEKWVIPAEKTYNGHNGKFYSVKMDH